MGCYSMSFTDITNQFPGEAETFDNWKTIYSEQPNTLVIIPLLLADEAAVWRELFSRRGRKLITVEPLGFWEGGGQVGEWRIVID